MPFRENIIMAPRRRLGSYQADLRMACFNRASLSVIAQFKFVELNTILGN